MKIGNSIRKNIGDGRYDVFSKLDNIVRFKVAYNVIEKMSIYGNGVRVSLRDLREEIYNKLHENR